MVDDTSPGTSTPQRSVRRAHLGANVQPVGRLPGRGGWPAIESSRAAPPVLSRGTDFNNAAV
jgi:hypothetical protein